MNHNGKLNSLSTDICYNIRHFEKHERDLDDPWSCRQSAIHQKHYFSDERSNWIVIQPPKLFVIALDRLERNNAAHPMALHVRYLLAAIANWRPYLNYITEKLAELVNTLFRISLKSSGSKVDGYPGWKGVFFKAFQGI